MTTNHKKRPGMMLYFDTVRPAINRLDAAQCGVLLRSLMDYAQYGVVPELDPMTGLAFDMLVPKIDRDAERYEDSREQRQYAVYVREKKKCGEAVMSMEEWRLLRARQTENNGPLSPEPEYIGPISPDRKNIGPYPSTSATASTAASTTASASSSTSLSPAPAAAGEGYKGEGEAQALYAEWLRALDAKDNVRALKLDGKLYALGYQTDIATRKLRKRAPPRR